MKKVVLFSSGQNSSKEIKEILKKYNFDTISAIINLSYISFCVKSALLTYKPHFVIFNDLDLNENQIKNIIEIFKNVNSPVIDFERKIFPVFIGKFRNYCERDPKGEDDFSIFIDEISELHSVFQKHQQKNNFKISNLFKIFIN